MSNVPKVSANKIILGEYALDKFNYYNKEKNNEITNSGSERLEVERLISGKNSDIDNLKSIIDKVLIIRIAANVLHIYTHADKREVARAFTNAIFLGFSPLLAEAMFLAVLTAWGTAQAITDVKKLLKNKKVSLFHTEETWSVSISSILDIAKNGAGDVGDDDKGVALSYKDYLRILLISTKQADIDNRMAGIIENNIKNEQIIKN